MLRITRGGDNTEEGQYTELGDPVNTPRLSPTSQSQCIGPYMWVFMSVEPCTVALF